MSDIYLMNKTTGEIVPSKLVFAAFYKAHTNCLDSVFDEWDETAIEVDAKHMSWFDDWKYDY